MLAMETGDFKLFISLHVTLYPFMCLYLNDTNKSLYLTIIHLCMEYI